MSKFLDDGWLEKEGFNMAEVDQCTKEKGFFAKLFGL